MDKPNAAAKTVTALVANKCFKCLGRGRFNGFRHVEQGVCFECNGTGVGTSLDITPTNDGETLCLGDGSGRYVDVERFRDLEREGQLTEIGRLLKSDPMNEILPVAARIALVRCERATARARAYYPGEMAKVFDAAVKAYRRA